MLFPDGTLTNCMWILHKRNNYSNVKIYLKCTDLWQLSVTLLYIQIILINHIFHGKTFINEYKIFLGLYM